MAEARNTDPYYPRKRPALHVSIHGERYTWVIERAKREHTTVSKVIDYAVALAMEHERRRMKGQGDESSS